VGVRLLADGNEVASWSGTSGSEFEIILYPLERLVGKTLTLEIFNNGSGGEEYLMLDHVMLMRRE